MWDEVDDEGDDSDLDVYVVLQAYEAQGTDELTLQEGEDVHVFSIDDEGEWMTGSVNDRFGRFPAKCVGTKM